MPRSYDFFSFFGTFVFSIVWLQIWWKKLFFNSEQIVKAILTKWTRKFYLLLHCLWQRQLIIDTLNSKHSLKDLEIKLCSTRFSLRTLFPAALCSIFDPHFQHLVFQAEIWQLILEKMVQNHLCFTCLQLHFWILPEPAAWIFIQSPANRWIVYKAPRPTTRSNKSLTPIFDPRNFNAVVAIGTKEVIRKIIWNEKMQKYLNETQIKHRN